MQRGLRVPAPPSRGSARRTPRPGRGELPAVERPERGLVEDGPGHLERLDPLPAILVGRQVVEPQRRMVRGSSGDRAGCRGRRSTSARCAPGIRVRPRAACRRSAPRSAGSGTSGSGSRRPRCCGRSRRPRSGSSRPGRCAGTATARRSRASAAAGRAASTPAACSRTARRPPGGPAGSRPRRAGRRRPGRRAAAAAPGSPIPDSCSSCGELIAPPHRTTSPASTRRTPGRAVRVLDADRARAVEQHPRDQGARPDVEVRPRHHRVQVRARRRQPPPAVDVAVERREALLAVPVDVLGQRVPRLLRRLKNAPNSGFVAGPRSSTSGPLWPRYASSGAAARQFSIRMK